ncbi:putative SWIM protein [Hordeum vulgare]|nr:putative SWIM protein [Hordeum vulgare]
MVCVEELAVAIADAQILPSEAATERRENSPPSSEMSTGKMNPRAPGWTKMLRIGAAAPSRAPCAIGAAAPSRAPCASRVSAFEKAVRNYADNPTDSVITPTTGTTFDSVGEAYDFYNLYSWEKGFGIRYGKRRLNVERTKCMQEIVCGCSGKAAVENTRSCRCECPALIRLLRAEDNGWSESANHKLKNYVPPGSLMHMFVQSYMRLQFDHESQENFEEKRTQIGRPLLRANLAVERHPSKIYTRAMFEQFGHILYERAAYQVEEIEEYKTYVAIHSEAKKRRKWCRVSYKVTMLDCGQEFDCECVKFAHMGLLCSHVLKVLDFIRAKEIPAKHIVKRWMKDTRDVLPAHLVQYQKDNMQNNAFS